MLHQSDIDVLLFAVVSQIVSGGETIHEGGLAVNDGGVVIKSPIGDILALYIRASGAYVGSALTIDGLTVCTACADAVWVFCADWGCVSS